jgi:hypothetical protein
VLGYLGFLCFLGFSRESVSVALVLGDNGELAGSSGSVVVASANAGLGGCAEGAVVAPADGEADGELDVGVGGWETSGGFKATTKPVIAVSIAATAVNIPGRVCNQGWWAGDSSGLADCGSSCTGYLRSILFLIQPISQHFRMHRIRR